MIRLTTLVAIATAVILAVSACGGSKKSSASSSAGGTSTVTNGSGSSSTGGSSSSGSSSSGSSSSGSSGSSSSGSSSSGSSSSGGSTTVSKSCLNFAGAATKLGEALGTAGSPSGNTDNVKKYFDELASKAPSDIKASFKTLAEAIGTYVDTIKGMNLKPGQTPSAGDIQKLQKAAGVLGQADVKAASTKIQAWVTAGCHS